MPEKVRSYGTNHEMVRQFLEQLGQIIHNDPHTLVSLGKEADSVHPNTGSNLAYSRASLALMQAKERRSEPVVDIFHLITEGYLSTTAILEVGRLRYRSRVEEILFKSILAVQHCDQLSGNEIKTLMAPAAKIGAWPLPLVTVRSTL